MTKNSKVIVSPTLPRVPLEVNGKEYFLVFDFNAIVAAEQLTGMNLLTSLDFSQLSATTLRALLYAALLRVQPDMTLEAAGSLLRIGTVAKVMKALGEAFAESHAEPDDEPKNDQQPEKN